MLAWAQAAVSSVLASPAAGAAGGATQGKRSSPFHSGPFNLGLPAAEGADRSAKRAAVGSTGSSFPEVAPRTNSGDEPVPAKQLFQSPDTRPPGHAGGVPLGSLKEAGGGKAGGGYGKENRGNANTPSGPLPFGPGSPFAYTPSLLQSGPGASPLGGAFPVRRGPSEEASAAAEEEREQRRKRPATRAQPQTLRTASASQPVRRPPHRTPFDGPSVGLASSAVRA
jgi:hypothetical protein